MSERILPLPFAARTFTSLPVRAGSSPVVYCPWCDQVYAADMTCMCADLHAVRIQILWEDPDA